MSYSENGLLSINYRLKNVGSEPILLRFDNGFYLDYRFINEHGEVVYHHSKKETKNENISDIRIKKGDEKIFDLEIPALIPGKYTVDVWTLAANSSQDFMQSIDVYFQDFTHKTNEEVTVKSGSLLAIKDSEHAEINTRDGVRIFNLSKQAQKELTNLSVGDNITFSYSNDKAIILTFHPS